MLPEALHKAHVVVIDDVAANLELLESNLRTLGIQQITSFSNSAAGLLWLQQNPWDLLLLDLDMPAPNGFDILEAFSKRDTSCAPILIATDPHETQARTRALQLGANDCFYTPIDIPELLLRVSTNLNLSLTSQSLKAERNLLEHRIQERTQELTETHKATLRGLCRAAQYRDNETGNHIVRIGALSAFLANALGQPAEWVENIRQAAPMHDIGKIAIPDHILNKSGGLTESERQIMKTHARIGYEILHDFQQAPLMAMAADIALSHHEKWDGTGYPSGLMGEQIPLSARIVSLCDVYDALRSIRPYKQRWSLEETWSFIQEQSGLYFDPQLVRCLQQIRTELEHMHQQFSDPEPLDAPLHEGTGIAP